jgi:hypothetical protein
MTDNKNYQRLQDRIRVDARDPVEVEYLQEKFPCLTHGEVLNAIREGGPFRKDIIRYIGKHILKCSGV